MSKKEHTQIVFDYSHHINGNIINIGNGKVIIDNRIINITNTRTVNNTRNNVKKNTVALGIGDSIIQRLANMLTGGNNH